MIAVTCTGGRNEWILWFIRPTGKVRKFLFMCRGKVPNNRGIMAIMKHLPGLTLTLLICATIIGPAAAVGYSVSVSSYGNGLSSNQISPSKLSVLNDYIPNKDATSAFSITSSEKIGTLGSAGSSDVTPSTGSVSAYSKINSRQQTDKGSVAMDFSESVSMSGSIYTFEYTVSFS